MEIFQAGCGGSRRVRSLTCLEQLWWSDRVKVWLLPLQTVPSRNLLYRFEGLVRLVLGSFR